MDRIRISENYSIPDILIKYVTSVQSVEPVASKIPQKIYIHYSCYEEKLLHCAVYDVLRISNTESYKYFKSTWLGCNS